MATEPLEQGEFKRGRGGRPTQGEAERRHRALLATAMRLFLERGCGGVSVDEISRKSGVAKRFIYARYPDKAALFVGAIMRFRQNLMGEMQALGPLPDDVNEGLVAFGRRLLDLALRPDVLAMHRLFIGEAMRFPQLAQLLRERFRGRGVEEIVAVLSRYAERGALWLGDDPEFTAEQFFFATVGLPQRMALLAGREPPEEEERRLRAAVRLFLDGCRAPAPIGGARP